MASLKPSSEVLAMAFLSPPPSDALWESLPSHLHELILAHVPASHHSRLRPVTRAWLGLFSSSHFRDLHRRLHPRLRPSFLVYNHTVKISALVAPPAPAGDATAAEEAPLWKNLPVPAPFVRELVGDGRSLVCLRSHLTSNAFSVGNVCSNLYKILPDPPRSPLLSKLWAMVPQASAGTSTNVYSIILLQLNVPSLYIDVYNSEKNSWTQRIVPKAACGKGSLVTFSSDAASIGGIVYSVQAESRSVVTYDVQTDKWKVLEARLPGSLVFQVPKEGGFIQVTPQVMHGCKGKLLLVGAAAERMMESTEENGDGDGDGDEKDGDDAGRKGMNYGVVWEMDWRSREWREMARAPQRMCLAMVEEAMESRKASVTPVRYCGHGELVIAMAAGSKRALRFDWIEEKWAWLDLPDAVNCDLSVCFDRPIL